MDLMNSYPVNPVEKQCTLVDAHAIVARSALGQLQSAMKKYQWSN
jgi:hypothetical protein